MILRELFYYDKETLEPIEDNRYEARDDESPVEKATHAKHVLHCAK